jgi:hypothetical protein
MDIEAGRAATADASAVPAQNGSVDPAVRALMGLGTSQPNATETTGQPDRKKRCCSAVPRPSAVVGFWVHQMRWILLAGAAGMCLLKEMVLGADGKVVSAFAQGIAVPSAVTANASAADFQRCLRADWPWPRETVLHLPRALTDSSSKALVVPARARGEGTRPRLRCKRSLALRQLHPSTGSDHLVSVLASRAHLEL